MPFIYGQRWRASNLAPESSIFSIEFMWLHHMVKYTLRRKVWIISVLCAHSPKQQEHKNMWILFSFLWIFISSADESLIKPSNFFDSIIWNGSWHTVFANNSMFVHASNFRLRSKQKQKHSTHTFCPLEIWFDANAQIIAIRHWIAEIIKFVSDSNANDKYIWIIIYVNTIEKEKKMVDNNSNNGNFTIYWIQCLRDSTYSG